MMISSRHRITIFLAVVSVVFSLLVLNRWLVTDVGMLSYRRLWPLFLNYSDFGFVRRALVGSLLSSSGLNRILDNQYVFAHLVHGVSILVLTFLVSLYILKHEDNTDTVLKAIAFLSPAFIIQSGYTTGRLDIFVLLLATAMILFVRSRYLFSLLLLLGVLIHELYLFTVPAQLLAFYRRTGGSDDLDFKRFIATFWLPGLCLSIGLVLIFFFGKADMPGHELEAVGQTMPSVNWSLFFELNSGIAENMELSLFMINTQYYRYPFFFWLMPLQLFYIGALCVVLVRNSDTPWSGALLIMAVLFPLLASLVAYDLGRWIGMSANMGILLLLSMAMNRPVSVDKWAYSVILPFSALAPFGTQIGRPFPIHQFIVEKLVM